MEAFQRYFDYLSEFETDEILHLIWSSTGRNLGILIPYSWDLRRPKRFKSLIKHCLLMILYSYLLVIMCGTAYLSYKYDMAFTVESITFAIFAMFPLLFLFINIFKHRSLIGLFKFIHEGFIKYQDFPENQEVTVRKKLEIQLEFCRKFWFVCFISCGPIGLLVIALDNKSREPDSLPAQINMDLPVPVWSFVDTTQPIHSLIMTILEVVFMLFLMSYSYGLFNSVTRFSLTYINECEIIAEALRYQEKRTVRKYVEFMKSQGVDINENRLKVVKLYRDKTFSRIFRECYKKIIEHHQIMVRYIDYINDFYGVMLVVIEYTYGGLLALCLCTALDNSLTISLRIFLFSIFLLILVLFCFVCFCGQTATDAMKDLHEEVYMSPWVNADEECKTLIKVFHVLTLTPGTVRSVLGGCINYQSLVTILQACYSVVNFIQLRNT